MAVLRTVLVAVLFVMQFLVAYGELMLNKPGYCQLKHRPTCKGRSCLREPKNEIKWICCDGYQYKDNNCVPLCQFGCDRGTCVAPNKCSCEKPLVLRKHACVDPICEQPCINGKCIGMNVCECDNGFQTINSTHCGPKCPQGYEADVLECKPVCDNCVRGICTAPNTCECNDGYKNDDKGSCVPVCDEHCNNGLCVEPNKCKCNSGYGFDPANKFNCLPICEPKCVYASCISPRTCSCLAGNETTGYNWICAPENGECGVLNECHCDEGYKKEKGVCTPICQRDFELKNDTCIAVELVDCTKCDGNCTEDSMPCRCADDKPCYLPLDIPAEVASSSRLAGLEMTWMLGAGLGVLLLTLVLVVMLRIWRKNEKYGVTSNDDGEQNGSVMYTVPHKLVKNNLPDVTGRPDDCFYEEVTFNTRGENPDEARELLNAKTTDIAIHN